MQNVNRIALLSTHCQAKKAVDFSAKIAYTILVSVKSVPVMNQIVGQRLPSLVLAGGVGTPQNSEKSCNWFWWGWLDLSSLPSTKYPITKITNYRKQSILLPHALPPVYIKIGESNDRFNYACAH